MISKSNRLMIVFFLIQSGLFVAIHFLELPLRDGLLHYLSIVVCAMLVFFVRGSDPELKWTRTAFFLTLAADWFLTYLQTQQWLGTALFLLSQLAYANRLLANAANPSAKIVERIAVSATLLAIGYGVVGRLDWLMTTALICYGLHLSNAVDATLRWISAPWFAVGLWLYVICDALVGLASSAGYLTIAPGSFVDGLVHGPIHWIWVFYLPSQTLIAASAVHPHLFEKKRMAV
jgi:hypothetical protein